MTLHHRLLLWWHRKDIARRKCARIDARIEKVMRQMWDSYIYAPTHRQARMALQDITLAKIKIQQARGR